MFEFTVQGLGYFRGGSFKDLCKRMIQHIFAIFKGCHGGLKLGLQQFYSEALVVFQDIPQEERASQVLGF